MYIETKYTDDIKDDLINLGILKENINHIHFNNKQILSEQLGIGLSVGAYIQNNTIQKIINSSLTDDLLGLQLTDNQREVLKNKDNILILIDSLLSNIQESINKNDLEKDFYKNQDVFILTENCIDFEKFSMESIVFYADWEYLLKNEEDKYIYGFIIAFMKKYFFILFNEMFLEYTEQEKESIMLFLSKKEKDLEKKLFKNSIKQQQEINNLIFNNSKN